MLTAVSGNIFHMQTDLPIQGDPSPTAPVQSIVTSVEAHSISALDAIDSDFLATIQGLASHTERLAMDAMTAARRAKDEGKDLEVLASEIRALARRATGALTEILTAMDSKSRALVRQDSIAQGIQARGSVTVMSEQEAALYRNNMSKGAREIEDIIGMPSMMILIAKCGGNTLYPFGNDLEFLFDLLGMEAADKLKKWLRGAVLTVPLCGSAKKAVIQSRIRAEFDRLTTIENLSAKRAVRNLTYFVSPPMHERTIWRILKRTDEPNEPTSEKCLSTSMDKWKGRVHRIK